MNAHCTEDRWCSICVDIARLSVEFDVQTLALCLPLDMQENRELWNVVLQDTPCALLLSPDVIKDDSELVQACVAKMPLTFKFASERLRNDYAVASAAVKRDPMALKYASDRLRRDASFVCMTLLGDSFGSCIQYGSEPVRDDENLGSISVARNGLNLKFLSERLRDDECIVKIACCEAPSAIHLASTRIQKIKSSYNWSGMCATLPAALLHHCWQDSHPPAIIYIKIAHWKLKRAACVLALVSALVPTCPEILQLLSYGIA